MVAWRTIVVTKNPIVGNIVAKEALNGTDLIVSCKMYINRGPFQQVPPLFRHTIPEMCSIDHLNMNLPWRYWLINSTRYLMQIMIQKTQTSCVQEWVPNLPTHVKWPNKRCKRIAQIEVTKCTYSFRRTTKVRKTWATRPEPRSRKGPQFPSRPTWMNGSQYTRLYTRPHRSGRSRGTSAFPMASPWWISQSETTKSLIWGRQKNTQLSRWCSPFCLESRSFAFSNLTSNNWLDPNKMLKTSLGRKMLFCWNQRKSKVMNNSKYNKE